MTYSQLMAAARSYEYGQYRNPEKHDPEDVERRKAERARWQSRHAKQQVREAFLSGRSL